VGILSMVLTSQLIHDPPYLTRRSFRSVKVDYVGFGLLALGLGSLEIVLDEGQRNDWFGSSFIAIFVVMTVVCLIAVVWWELRQKEPIIDFHVLKERNYALATLSMLVLGFVLYGSTTLLPLLLQTLLGYTALLSGLVLSPGGVVICICMPIVGFLLRKVQARWLVIFGVVVSTLGLLRMAQFTLDIDMSTAVWGRIVQSLGLAFMFVPISTVAFQLIAKERMNYATGLFNLARNLGGSSGIAMVTTMLARRAQFHQSVLVSHMTPYDPAYQQALTRTAAAITSAGSSPADAGMQAQGVLYGTLLKQANMLAFSDVFWIMGVLFLAIIPLMLLLRPAGPVRGPISAGH
jgi:DHA2 family multidrug resistance protein